jgi:hypothetical protein
MAGQSQAVILLALVEIIVSCANLQVQTQLHAIWKLYLDPKECVHAILLGPTEILLEHLQRRSVCDSTQ